MLGNASIRHVRVAGVIFIIGIFCIYYLNQPDTNENDPNISDDWNREEENTNSAMDQQDSKNQSPQKGEPEEDLNEKRDNDDHSGSNQDSGSDDSSFLPGGGQDHEEAKEDESTEQDSDKDSKEGKDDQGETKEDESTEQDSDKDSEDGKDNFKDQNSSTNLHETNPFSANGQHQCEDLKLDVERVKSNIEEAKDENNVENIPLIKHPEVSETDEIACLPKVFGYSDEQEKEFLEKIEEASCEQTEKIFTDYKNKIISDCEGAEMVRGSSPLDEAPGMSLSLEWSTTDELELKDSEFAFIKCNEKLSASLKNKVIDFENPMKNLTLASGENLKVVVLMFDSLSRFHFYRNFPKTIESLGKDSDKVTYDFIAYNTASHHSDLVYQNGTSLFDYFKQMGFVTMFGTDIITEPLMPACPDHIVHNFYRMANEIEGMQKDCIGGQTYHSFMFDYVSEFMKNYENENKFAFVYLSSGLLPDKELSEFIKEATEDTLIFVTGLNGLELNHHFEHIETIQESRLPVNLVISTKKLMNRMGSHEIVKHNSNRLTSIVDLHVSLRHLAFIPYGNLKKDSKIYKGWRENIPHAQSIFMEKFEDKRTCEDIKLDQQFCSCDEFQTNPEYFSKNIDVVTTLVNLAVDELNLWVEQYPDLCQPVSLTEVLESIVSRNGAIEVQAKLNKNAIFNFIGLMKENSGEDNQETNAEIYIDRVDNNLCVPALLETENPEYCVCKEYDKNNENLQNIYSKAASEIALVYGESNCDYSCEEKGLQCHDSIFKFLKDSNEFWDLVQLEDDKEIEYIPEDIIRLDGLHEYKLSSDCSKQISTDVICGCY